MLLPEGWYAVVKRFSAKSADESLRLLVATGQPRQGRSRTT